VPKFALDTNVYIEAIRDSAHREALKNFFRDWLPSCHLSAIVLEELLLGALTEDQADALENEFAGPFLRRARIFAPSVRSWGWSGRILARLSRGRPDHLPRSLPNDVLLATSCREEGIAVITRDRDFRRLVRFVPGLVVLESYPRLRSRPERKRDGAGN